eukprot:GHRR01007464.1.p1 GENE.GHRR01007464.1~~GHRR01007464.1.p1  ORF type:complete len:436 (+),score=155.51 GHRR01007464.1:95-1402(+)
MFVRCLNSLQAGQGSVHRDNRSHGSYADKDHQDRLKRAANAGSLTKVCRLVRQGAADPKQVHQTSALQLAAREGHLDIVKVLVEAGADVNRAADKSSPLLEAAAAGHVEVVDHLLEHKADANRAVEGNTALHLAARFGHTQVAQALARVMDISWAVVASNSEGKTPLMMACCQQQGGEAVVAYLLQAGSDPAATDLAGNTALHHAVTAGNRYILSVLLSDKHCLKCLNKANTRGQTPMHLAAVFGHLEVMFLLGQQQEVDVNVADEEGSTALHMACKSVMCGSNPRQGLLVKTLVEFGAELEVKDHAGNRPIDYAATAMIEAFLHNCATTPAIARSTEGVLEVNPAQSKETEEPAEQGNQAMPITKMEKMACLSAGILKSLAADPTGSNDHTTALQASWIVKQALHSEVSETSESGGGWRLRAGHLADAEQPLAS